jgi:hypothetical protein
MKSIDHHLAHSRQPLVLNHRQINPVNTLSRHFFKTPFNIFVKSKTKSSKLPLCCLGKLTCLKFFVPKFGIRLSSPTYATCPVNVTVKSTNYEVPHYAIFSRLAFFLLSCVQIFSRACKLYSVVFASFTICVNNTFLWQLINIIITDESKISKNASEVYLYTSVCKRWM